MKSFDHLLAASLSRTIPHFERLVSARRLSGGASQETYRVELETRDGKRTLALRRAPSGGAPERERERIGPGLAAEADLFRIARAAGVPEPEILHVFEPSEELGEGFLMEWLEGETVGSRILRAPELDDIRPRLAYACGEILARIHSIDPIATGLSECLATVSTRDFITEIWEIYRSFETAFPMIDFTARWLLDHLPNDAAPSLVHNDFRNGNIMVAPNGIVAVLDWELAHLGDPIRDLGWICTNSWRFGRHDLPVGGFGRVEDLLDGYESVSEIRVDREHLRFWEVFGSFWWAAMSLNMAFAWRNGIDQTVERPGIARRSSECQVDCANLIIPGPVTLVDPDAPASSVDMPRMDELLRSVRDFLRHDARQELDGRNAFLALVASNSLDIAQRELTLGPAHLRAERERLRALFPNSSKDSSVAALRAKLSKRLRDGSIALDHPGLAEHLRITAANQLAIDQPKYSGLAAALAADA